MKYGDNNYILPETKLDAEILEELLALLSQRRGYGQNPASWQQTDEEGVFESTDGQRVMPAGRPDRRSAYSRGGGRLELEIVDAPF